MGVEVGRSWEGRPRSGKIDLASRTSARTHLSLAQQQRHSTTRVISLPNARNVCFVSLNAPPLLGKSIERMSVAIAALRGEPPGLWARGKFATALEIAISIDLIKASRKVASLSKAYSNCLSQDVTGVVLPLYSSLCSTCIGNYARCVAKLELCSVRELTSTGIKSQIHSSAGMFSRRHSTCYATLADR